MSLHGCMVVIHNELEIRGLQNAAPGSVNKNLPKSKFERDEMLLYRGMNSLIQICC